MIRFMQTFPEALAQAITAVDEALDVLGAGGVPLDDAYVCPVLAAQHELSLAATAWEAAGRASVEPLGVGGRGFPRLSPAGLLLSVLAKSQVGTWVGTT